MTDPLRGALAALLITILLVPSAKADIALDFGLYTSDKPTEIVRAFRLVLRYLERDISARLGEKTSIRIQVAGGYEKGIENLVASQVDFARFGPASYVLAKQANPALEILAVESVHGKKIFHGVICVAQDSDVEDVRDLRGRSFAFGNEQSTIGRYLSQRHLLKNGITASDLGRYEYLGRHDKVGTAVGLGQFDAGALKEGTFKKLVAKGVSIRALATFPNVTKPWIARECLPTRIRDAIRASLLAMDYEIVLNSMK